jgi:copper/silver efflux system protein
MITTIIRNVIRFRVFIIVLVALGILSSAYAIVRAPLDAIPDISDPQIVIYVKWPRSPQLLETEVTEPLIKALAGSPDIQATRGTSHMGYSFIYVILNSGALRERVHQAVLDRVNAIRPQLPSDATIALGPNASSIGWIYQYAVLDREGTRDLRDLRLLNEGVIKRALQSVPGIAEVASVGGLEKQYQVKLFPPLLAQTGVSLKQVTAALQNVFEESGGRTIEVTNREYQLRGTIKATDLDSLEFIPLGRDKDGKTVLLKDVGYLQVGYDQRRSTADLDGNGEVVGGIVVMAQDQNVLAITRSLDDKVREVSASLPRGIEIIPTYDRSAWIWATLTEFFTTLIAELVVVSLVTILFLRNVRAAIGPIVILLLSVLFTVLPMVFSNQTINLFSLAGLCLAIGEIADATIVIVENCAAELALNLKLSYAQKRELIIRSIASVAKPLLFSLLIILASFLPVFFLEQREARLFNPLAYSKTFGMAFSTLLTLFLLPIIVVWVFKPETTRPRDSALGRMLRNRTLMLAGSGILLVVAVLALRRFASDFRTAMLQLTMFLLPVLIIWFFQRRTPASQNFRESAPVRMYRRSLMKMIEHRYVFTGIGLAILISAIFLVRSIGKDFLPDTDEGSVLYMPSTLPGLPSREAGWVLQQMDKKLKAIPEVERVFGKLGRADTSTDPAPVTMVETTILLKPKSQWRPGMTKETVVADMDNSLQTLGYVNTWVQPIRARAMMQSTGIQTPVGIKVKGPDITQVEEIAQQIEGLLRTFPGTKSVIAERISEGYYIDVQNDLQRMAEHNVAVEEAMLTVRYAIGGDNVVGVKQADNTVIPLSLQYSPEYLDTVEKVKTSPVITQDGRSVRLADIADVSVRKLPEMIRNDNGSLAGYIYVDLENVTAPDYVDRAKAFLSKNLNLPAGYAVEWTGVYQYTEDARGRLKYIVPLTLIIIFGLLMLAFKSVAETVLIMLSVPFALVGGVFLQWLLGYPMTTAVIIGYISLFAVAIQTGIIMVAFIREAIDKKAPTDSYEDAVIEGSAARLRPKLMTVATTLFSLFPIPFSQGTGMEILKPIATPSIGGMVTSTIHVLFMTPLLFVIQEDVRQFLRRRRELKKSRTLERTNA